MVFPGLEPVAAAFVALTASAAAAQECPHAFRIRTADGKASTRTGSPHAITIELKWFAGHCFRRFLFKTVTGVSRSRAIRGGAGLRTC
ncbi:MAG: hypothetical protein AB7H81_26120 [Vicinamibacterales bacterium]